MFDFEQIFKVRNVYQCINRSSDSHHPVSIFADVKKNSQQDKEAERAKLQHDVIDVCMVHDDDEILEVMLTCLSIAVIA